MFGINRTVSQLVYHSTSHMQLRLMAKEILNYVEPGNTRNDVSARQSIRLCNQFLSFIIFPPKKHSYLFESLYRVSGMIQYVF